MTTQPKPQEEGLATSRTLKEVMKTANRWPAWTRRRVLDPDRESVPGKAYFFALLMYPLTLQGHTPSEGYRKPMVQKLSIADHFEGGLELDEAVDAVRYNETPCVLIEVPSDYRSRWNKWGHVRRNAEFYRQLDEIRREREETSGEAEDG
jgi:hypothetical protein